MGFPVNALELLFYGSFSLMPNEYRFESIVLTNTWPFEIAMPLKCAIAGMVSPLL